LVAGLGPWSMIKQGKLIACYRGRRLWCAAIIRGGITGGADFFTRKGKGNFGIASNMRPALSQSCRYAMN
jgi:hypothetical protein